MSYILLYQEQLSATVKINGKVGVWCISDLARCQASSLQLIQASL